MTHYTNDSYGLQTVFSYGRHKAFDLNLKSMEKQGHNVLRKELTAMREQLGFSMEDMAKHLGYSTPSGYQYYEDKNGYNKEYFDYNFLTRLKKLVPLGISEDRINALGPPGLGKQKIFKLDAALLKLCASEISKAADEQQLDMTMEDGVYAAGLLYEHIIQHRQKDSTLMPSEALADLILKQIYKVSA